MKKRYFLKNLNSAGFTLVELIMGIFIFSLIIVSAFGIFSAAIKNQNRTIFSVRMMDQASYATEYMSRALRMAEKDLQGTCITEDMNYSTTTRGGTEGIKFKSWDNECQEFFIERTGSNSRLMELKYGREAYLTSEDIYVEKFYIGPEESWYQTDALGEMDNLQPRVTIFLEFRKNSSDSASYPKFKAQITVSQRRADILE